MIKLNISTDHDRHSVNKKCKTEKSETGIWSWRQGHWHTVQAWVIICLIKYNFTFNSLAPRKFEQNSRIVIFKLISVTDGWGISCKITLRWMPLDLTDDISTLIQVMAWCRQATSHYLSNCWPRSLSPYGVNRPQWVKAHLCSMHETLYDDKNPYILYHMCYWSGNANSHVISLHGVLKLDTAVIMKLEF